MLSCRAVAPRGRVPPALVAGLLGGFLAWSAATAAAQAIAPRVAHVVVGSYPHDPQAFTQGLVWHDGGFYESTGGYGRSTLRRVEFPSGRVLRRIDLPRELFGEGLAMVRDRLVQLTWREGRGLIYDRQSFRLVREFRYATEGWGLTWDGTHLVMSDGSDVLTFLDPERLAPIRRLPVTWDGHPVRNLNELEAVEGEIWANVWYRDVVVRIDPRSGQVSSYLDLGGLLAPGERPGRDAVLNGIAYDPAGRRVFVVGKLWPRLFEIRVRPGP